MVVIPLSRRTWAIITRATTLSRSLVLVAASAPDTRSIVCRNSSAHSRILGESTGAGFFGLAIDFSFIVFVEPEANLVGDHLDGGLHAVELLLGDGTAFAEAEA